MNQVKAEGGRFAVNILACAALLGLLYAGRSVLIPVAFAIFLSLILNPCVRALQRVRLPHAVAVVIAVLGMVVAVFALLGVLGTQLVHLARHLPAYEVTIRDKVKVIRELTEGRLTLLQDEIGRVFSAVGPSAATNGMGMLPGAGDATVAATGVPSAAASTPASSLSLARIASSAWAPIEAVGIVVVVLGFVLLEHESLRDRFIRLIGGTDLRSTTEAINEAGDRLSRYFLSTFCMNLGVGITLWAGLSLIGVPNAALWASLTAALRFVPYVGVWGAALTCSVFAMAVVPGWSLAIMVVLLFAAVELVAAQVVEPMLYGHATGLSPLAVVVAAIFWSWLWGPVGLVLSTPLTLCLMVAGRHVEPLGKLNILLGDTPALTLPQRFYQRGLSGDSAEVLADAKTFLKRKSFAAYADAVLLPALQLARMDLQHRAINPVQLANVRRVIEAVVEVFGSEGNARARMRRPSTVLDATTVGQRLRQRREAAPSSVSGAWLSGESRVLCVSLGSVIDDLATEVFRRILRALRIDARHVSVAEYHGIVDVPDPVPDVIAMVYLMSAEPARETSEVLTIARDAVRRLPDARIVRVQLPEPLILREKPEDASDDTGVMIESLEEAAQLAIARFPSDGV